jgi:hypothetical protein
MQPAALTLLVGIGKAGQHVAAGAWERLEAEPLARAGGVKLLARGGGGEARADAVCDDIREAISQLTRQRTVAAVEKTYAIRRPAGRYLRLQIVCAAALAEAPAHLLLECLRAIQGLKHPAAGLQLLFVLDVTHPREPGDVAPDALATLELLQAEWEALQSRSRRDWSAAPCFRCFLAHPHRADGSHLEPDEYPAALAAAVAGHVAPGPLHDALAPAAEPDPSEPPFALLGWASDVFPRERLLERASALLAADLLKLTACGGALGARRSALGEEGPALAERRAGGRPIDPSAERGSEASLDRRRLLVRLLSPDVEESPIQVDAAVEAPRPSFYQRIRERIWGRPSAGTGSGAGTGQPLRVRLDLHAGAWRSGDPRRWPAELLVLDARGAQEFDAAVQLLQQQQVSQKAVRELSDAFAASADLCVRRDLGGTQAARERVERALREAERRVRQADAVPFGEPDLPRDLGLSTGAGLAEAWHRFRLECERLPGWPAVLARGLAFGALGTTACGALGEGAQSGTSLLLGWIGVGVSLAAAILWYGGALDRLRRLGEYVAECIRAKYGRRLLEYAQLAAGTPKREGVYQALIRQFRDVEIPTLDHFESERAALIEQMRQNPPFAPPDGTAALLADASEAAELYRSVRQSLSDSCLAEQALELLRDDDIYAGWRRPAMEPVRESASTYARRKHLVSWERKPLGDFLRDLLRFQAPPERLDDLFAARVARQVDQLALRSVPLAPGPFGAALGSRRSALGPIRIGPSPAERQAPSAESRSEASVVLAIPPSLGWPHGDAGAGALLPADSVAGSLATWFGPSPNAVDLRPDEADLAGCVVTIAGLCPASVLQALGDERQLGARGSGLGEGSGAARELAASETVGSPLPTGAGDDRSSRPVDPSPETPFSAASLTPCPSAAGGHPAPSRSAAT